MNALSDKAKATIRSRGLSGYAVAQQAGLRSPIVNRWLKGERGLTLDSFERIAEALGLGLSEDRRKKGLTTKGKSL